MPIRKGQLIHLLRNHTTPTNLTNTDTFISDQLRFTLNDTKNKFLNEQISDSIGFALWNDTWNNIGIFGPNKDNMVTPQAKDKYPRGQKVFVDLGFNVGKEASMVHPAIIVKNFKELAIIVTTTSDDSPELGELEKMVIHVPKDGTVFPGDDLVELHQIRCIGKNRIIKNLNQNVKDYILPNIQIDNLNKFIQDRLSSIGAKLKNPVLSYGTDLRTVIDMMLAFHYSPDTFNHLAKTQSALERLEDENNKLTAELERYKLLSEAATGIKDKENG